MHDTILQDIEIGLERLGLASERAGLKLTRYVMALARWNKIYNLTAVRQPQDMVTRHILDSLSVLPWLHGPHIIDVGSGAGLPGIPLAIMCPEVDFVLLDSNAKRTRFLIQMRAELMLDNVTVEQARAQNRHLEQDAQNLFDSVISRAFSSLADFVASAGRLCAENGRILAMKGRYPEAELRQLPETYKLIAVHRLQVPGLGAERHLVHLEPMPTCR